MQSHIQSRKVTRHNNKSFDARCGFEARLSNFDFAHLMPDAALKLAYAALSTHLEVFFLDKLR
jgi:hypothetical protein